MSVTAAQLVFTNVEADRSPVRRRGDQVWLKTPGAFDKAREVQEIAARLSDFKMPQPPSRDPQAHAGWERVQFFATAAGRFVLARSVALTSGDKYNRGGRFHAHALVLEKPEFRRTGSDPFALLDGFTGRWHATPDDSLARGGNWQAGAVPAVEIRPGPGTTTAEPLPPAARETSLLPLVRLLLADRVVAVPAPPARVLALARQLFAWLPPKLRERASFDTLSTGLDLGKTTYWLVGAGSPELLRLWRFRSYEMWKPDAGRFDRDPKLDGDPGLFEQWLAARAREADRPPRLDRLRLAWSLAQALDTARLDGIDLNSLSEDLFGEMSAAAIFPKKRTELVEAQIRQALPAALTERVRPTVEQAVSALGLAGLRNLQAELTPAKLAETLTKQFAARETSAPSREELDALGQFLDQHRDTFAGNADAGKLRLVRRRWLGQWDDLCDELHAPGSGDELFHWFADWALTTLPYKKRIVIGRIHPNTIWVGPLLTSPDPARGQELQALLECLAGVSRDVWDVPESRTAVRLSDGRLYWLLERLAGAPDPAAVAPAPEPQPEPAGKSKRAEWALMLLARSEGDPRKPFTAEQGEFLAEQLTKLRRDSLVPHAVDKLQLLRHRWRGESRDWGILAHWCRDAGLAEWAFRWFADQALRSLPVERQAQVGRLGPAQAWLGAVVCCRDAYAGYQLLRLVAALAGVLLPTERGAAVEVFDPTVPAHRRDWLLWDLLNVRLGV